jgi:glycine/D-amino acid oxidase-like deaminating enzyme
VIVGAGVVGAALAYEAARTGLRVTVLERARRPAQGGTRWSMGGASWLTWAGEPRLRELSREGLDRYRMLSDELGTDCGFRPVPMVVLAPDAAVLDRLAELVKSARPHGFSGRIIGADELRALEPALAPDAAVGAAVCEQGRLDTVRLTEVWLTVAEHLGATVRYGVEVEAVDQDARGSIVRTPDGPIAADRVVVAAGAWARRLLRASGRDVAILHTHAEVLETEPLPPMVNAVVVGASQARAELERAIAAPELATRWDHETDHEVVPAIVELGVTQFEDGRVRLGQVSRAATGFPAGPSPAGEAILRAEVGRYFPSLAVPAGPAPRLPGLDLARPPPDRRTAAGRTVDLGRRRAGRSTHLPAGPGAPGGGGARRRDLVGADAVLADPLRRRTERAVVRTVLPLASSRARASSAIVRQRRPPFRLGRIAGSPGAGGAPGPEPSVPTSSWAGQGLIRSAAGRRYGAISPAGVRPGTDRRSGP